MKTRGGEGTYHVDNFWKNILGRWNKQQPKIKHPRQEHTSYAGRTARRQVWSQYRKCRRKWPEQQWWRGQAKTCRAF